MKNSVDSKNELLPDLGLYLKFKDNKKKVYIFENIFFTSLFLIDENTSSFNTQYCYDDKIFLLTIDIPSSKLGKFLKELEKNEIDFYCWLIEKFRTLERGEREIDFYNKAIMLTVEAKIGKPESSATSGEEFIPFVLTKIKSYKLIDKINLDS